ncbi:LysR family transcriptional regulator [bacterium]|nr:LysR family transcriptional regulator [bacterium]
MMNLEQLRGFYTVVQEGSFTKAAKKLFRTQPAISSQIKLLEDELGEPLFQRIGKTIRLTQAGEILQQHVVYIFDHLDIAQSQIQELHGLQRGRLVIGSSDTITIYILPQILKSYRQRYPNIEIAIRNKTSLEVAELVLEGVVDFGIVTLPIKHEMLDVEVLCDYPDVAICPIDHPLANQKVVSLANLSSYPLLLLEPGSNTRRFLEEVFAAHDIQLHSAMDLGSVDVIKQMVGIGLGVSIVPLYAVRADADAQLEFRTPTEGLVVLPIKELPPRQIGVIRSRQSDYLSLAGKEFVSMFKQYIRKNPNG